MQQSLMNISLLWLLSMIIIVLFLCEKHAAQCGIIRGDDRIVFPDEYGKIHKDNLTTTTTTTTTTTQPNSEMTIATKNNKPDAADNKNLKMNATKNGNNWVEPSKHDMYFIIKSLPNITKMENNFLTTTTTTKTISETEYLDYFDTTTASATIDDDEPVTAVKFDNRIAIDALPVCAPGFILTEGKRCRKPA